MICFQSIIFDILKTTRKHRIILERQLWFAFNLLSLTYWKQLTACGLNANGSCDLLSIYYLWHTENNLVLEQPERLHCCDLLSIYYLWHTENNISRQINYLFIVVICFQSIIFDILKTTRVRSSSPGHLLWFAFNLLSLTYWKQQQRIYKILP